MRDPVRLLVLGTGQMGAGIVRLVGRRRGLALVGVFGRRTERAGLDVGTTIGLDAPLGLPIRSDLERLCDEVRPDVAIQTTCSRASDAEPELTALLERGVDAITIAEEMAWPAAQSPEVAARLDALARARGATLLGTGVNPGFVLDLLILVLTAVCADVTSITATRTNDLSPYGPTVLAAQGVGLSPDAFRRGVEAGSVIGHFGFRESIAMIAATLGWEIERVEETREPIVARVRRKTPFVTVEPGRVAGCEHTAVARVAGRTAISLVHPQQVHPELEGVATGDRIEIDGTPPVRLSGSPEIPGGLATVALAVNAIPRVLAAPPGLVSMADLPPPAAVLGDARQARDPLRRPDHG